MAHRRKAIRADAHRALVAQFEVESSRAFPVSSEQLSQWLAAEAPRRDTRPSTVELAAFTPTTASASTEASGHTPSSDAAQAPHTQPSRGLAHLPGLIVTPGAGGRRRAPDPDEAIEGEPHEDAHAGAAGDEPSPTAVDDRTVDQVAADGTGMGMGELLAEALLALRSGETASRAGHREAPVDDDARSGWPRRTVDPDEEP
jgi:hypothetical protein